MPPPSTRSNSPMPEGRRSASADVDDVVGLGPAAACPAHGAPRARGGRRRLLPLLREAVPLAAVGAAAEPLRALEAAGLAGEDRLELACVDFKAGSATPRPPPARPRRRRAATREPTLVRTCQALVPAHSASVPGAWARRRRARLRRRPATAGMVGDVGHGEVHADGARHRDPLASHHERCPVRDIAARARHAVGVAQGDGGDAGGTRRHPAAAVGHGGPCGHLLDERDASRE